MAKYDRRMLIPYLRDLYCTELLLMYKKEQHRAILERKRKLTDRLAGETEMEAPGESYSNVPVVLCLLSAVLCAVAILCAVFFGNSAALFRWLLVICLVLGLLCVLLLIGSRKRRKKQREFQQWKKERKAEQEKIRRKTEDYDRQLEELTEMCSILHGIRHSLYSVNIIPAHYRTVQVVQYLLEYIKTSKANDPDLVLQTYAIEQIRNPHMQIDRKMAEMTLHQRLLLATQIVADEVQNEYALAQLRNIAQQEPKGDLRMQYEKIILENWNLSDYLLKYEQH